MALVTAGALAAGCASGAVDTAALPTAPGGAVAAAPGTECPAVKPAGDGPQRQVRGMWISSVYGGDWPGDPQDPVEKKKASYRRILDSAKAAGLNTVFMQIRPAGDAFYASPYEPWSQWLTGTPGKDPGWDPLKFLVDEAHARDLEFQAWFNPYRVGGDNNRKHLAPRSPAKLHPDWAVKYGKYLWYDPGLPQVRELATNAVLDVVGKYDIDGVHFDDYFYPYPDGKFPDAKTFKTYGRGMGLADWRRHNVDTLVQSLSVKIKQAKPWVKFGISPFGIWRNRSGDPAGSDTHGLDSYAEIYGDTRKWVKQGWLDYVTPQLYWAIGDNRADYKTLVAWWSRLVEGTRVQLTIGQAATVGGSGTPWPRRGEVRAHLDVNTAHPQVRGNVFFSAADVLKNSGGFVTQLRAGHYERPALIPPSKGGNTPAAPSQVRVVRSGRTTKVEWQGSDATSYAVYRTTGKGGACTAVNGANLVATTRGSSVLVPSAQAGKVYTYTVTALDRTHVESGPARAVTFPSPSSP
ncbi:MAG: family 10 glycosylhydrolase [Streptosporangiaceae bacterium]